MKLVSIQKQLEPEVRNLIKLVRTHKKPYSVNINGINLSVFPNVFSPLYFTDSIWFAKAVQEIVGQNSLLEIGTGTGIIALFAGLNGAEITATDINIDAIKNAEYNFNKYKINARTYCGDVYNPLPKDAKFDFIFWNHPFNLGDNPNEDILSKSAFDFQYSGLEKYISEAKFHLNPSGRLLLGTSSFALLSDIEKLALRYNYEMVLLKKVNIPIAADPSIENDYRIYELIKMEKI